MAGLLKTFTQLTPDIPAVTSDTYFGGDDTANGGVTKRVPGSSIRNFVLGIALGVATIPETTLKLGADAAAGTDTVAADHTTIGPLSRGAGAPAGMVFQVGVQGSTGTGLQTPTDALILQEVANAIGREVALWNPSGPVMGLLPLDTSVTLLNATDGGRFANTISAIRAAGNAVLLLGRVNTSFAAPSQVVTGNVLGSLSYRGYDNAGTFAEIASIYATARESLTATNRGSSVRINVTDLGSSSSKLWAVFQGGGTNVAEFLTTQATFRFIPGATGFAFRDSTNVSDTFTLNAAGTTITFPIATSFVVGADPGGGQLARIGGSLRATGAITFDSTLTQNGTTASLVQGASGSLLVGANASTSSELAINGATATNRSLAFRTANVERWTLRANSDAESGANAGSNLLIIARTDLAAVIDAPLAITRAAGGTIAFSSARPITGGTYNGNTLGTATVTFPAATAFVVGADPGSAAILRVGGSVISASANFLDQLISYRSIGTLNTAIGSVAFQGNNGSGSRTTYAHVAGRTEVVTAGSETGQLLFAARSAGVLTDLGIWSPSRFTVLTSMLVNGSTAATNSPKLDVLSGSGNVATAWSDVTTDVTNKIARLGTRHYTNSEEVVALITAINTNTANTIYFGGGTSAMNTATEMRFHLGATVTTLTGTEYLRLSIPAAGETSLWVYDADNASLERVTIGAADSGGAGFKLLRIPN